MEEHEQDVAQVKAEYQEDRTRIRSEIEDSRQKLREKEKQITNHEDRFRISPKVLQRYRWLLPTHIVLGLMEATVLFSPLQVTSGSFVATALLALVGAGCVVVSAGETGSAVKAGELFTRDRKNKVVFNWKKVATLAIINLGALLIFYVFIYTRIAEMEASLGDLSVSIGIFTSVPFMIGVSSILYLASFLAGYILDLTENETHYAQLVDQKVEIGQTIQQKEEDLEQLRIDRDDKLEALKVQFERRQREIRTDSYSEEEPGNKGDKNSGTLTLLALVSLCFSLFSCGGVEGDTSSRQNTQIVYMLDLTGGKQSPCEMMPTTAQIQTSLNISSQHRTATGHYGAIEVYLLNGTVNRQSHHISLPDPGGSWKLETGRTARAVAKFTKDFEALRDRVCAIEPKEYDHSRIYVSFCQVIQELHERPGDRKVVVLASDLLEFTELLNLYTYRSDPAVLMKNYEQITQTLLSQCSLPEDLTGIEVVLDLPSSNKDDGLVFQAQLLYQRLLTDLGAKVSVL
ncbi:MAG: hypothetical protein AAFO69_07170 [Bacteroidota bacterium]